MYVTNLDMKRFIIYLFLLYSLLIRYDVSFTQSYHSGFSRSIEEIPASNDVSGQPNRDESSIKMLSRNRGIILQDQNFWQQEKNTRKPVIFKLHYIEIGLVNSWFYYRSIKDYEFSFISRRFNSSSRSVSIDNSQFLGFRTAAFATLLDEHLSLGIGLSLRKVEYAFDAGFSANGIACDGTSTSSYSALSFQENQKWTEIPIIIKYTLGKRRPLLSIFGGFQLHLMREAAYKDITYEGVYYFGSEDPGFPCVDYVGDIFPGGFAEYSLFGQDPSHRIKSNYSLFAGLESDFLEITNRLSIFGQLTYGHLFKSWVNNQEEARSQNILRSYQIDFEEDDFAFDYLNISLGVRYHFIKLK